MENGRLDSPYEFMNLSDEMENSIADFRTEQKYYEKNVHRLFYVGQI